MVKVNVSLVDMADFAAINAVYEQYAWSYELEPVWLKLPKGARIK